MKIELDNEGQRILLEKTSKRGQPAALARKISEPPAMVSKWRSGVRPVYRSRVKLRATLGIPEDAWDRPASKRSIDKGAA